MCLTPPRWAREHSARQAISPLPLADGFPVRVPARARAPPQRLHANPPLPQVLATELPGSTMREKERYTQVLFEELGASSVLLVNQAYAALTAFAENTGVVVDLGHETIGTRAADPSSLRNALDAGCACWQTSRPSSKGSRWAERAGSYPSAVGIWRKSWQSCWRRAASS